MNTCRVMLIGSDDLVWRTLDAAVRSLEGVKIGGSVCNAIGQLPVHDGAVDVIFLRYEMPPAELAWIADTMAVRWPQSKVVMVADDFYRGVLDVPSSIRMSGFLLSSDLSLETLRQSLQAATSSDMVIVSRSVPARAVALLRGITFQSSTCAPALTGDERMMLELLVRGLNQKQIAEATDSSLRTVKRRMAALTAKFKATSAFILGLRVAGLGIVPGS
jgi:DNA-binding NarL/FixJ family response regulator